MCRVAARTPRIQVRDSPCPLFCSASIFRLRLIVNPTVRYHLHAGTGPQRSDKQPFPEQPEPRLPHPSIKTAFLPFASALSIAKSHAGRSVVIIIDIIVAIVYEYHVYYLYRGCAAMKKTKRILCCILSLFLLVCMGSGRSQTAATS